MKVTLIIAFSLLLSFIFYLLGQIDPLLNFLFFTALSVVLSVFIFKKYCFKKKPTMKQLPEKKLMVGDNCTVVGSLAAFPHGTKVQILRIYNQSFKKGYKTSAEALVQDTEGKQDYIFCRMLI